MKHSTKTFKTHTNVESESNSLSIKQQLVHLVLICLLILAGNGLFANNLQISNVVLTGQNTTDHYSLVNFDISWDNSWRVSTTQANWDAAWVFVKYRVKTQTYWHHATLHYVNGSGSGDGHTEPANSDINSANDNNSGGAYGVFIRHNYSMTQGSVNYAGVKLRWDYGVDGLADGDLVEICVLGIEMVYVPQGSFYVGSGGSEINHFYAYPTSTKAYSIYSESSITVGTTNGNLYYSNSNGDGGDQAGPIPYNFPKGYNAFYCMKYEITQDQYTSFLNKLTVTQDSYRFPNENGYLRHAIAGSPGSRTTTKPYVACNYLSWEDIGAYLDWAALRPMTELEYEKVCRGNPSPVANEYAWGNTTITQATGISNDGATNETASNSGANCVCAQGNGGIQGPVRVGCFGQGVNTRTGVGASYYGIMELSGNLGECVVTVGGTNGRAFTGENGNGELDYGGDANVSNWPSGGVGIRGGDWHNSSDHLRVSDRSEANDGAVGVVRDAVFGGRGCRVAP